MVEVIAVAVVASTSKASPVPPFPQEPLDRHPSSSSLHRVNILNPTVPSPSRRHTYDSHPPSFYLTLILIRSNVYITHDVYYLPTSGSLYVPIYSLFYLYIQSVAKRSPLFRRFVKKIIKHIMQVIRNVFL